MRLTPKLLIATALLAAAFPSARAVTLEECLAAARADNPGLAAAEHRVRSAEAAARQAASALYPWLKTSAQYARTDNPPQAFMMSLNQRELNMADPAFNPNEPDDTENLRLSAQIQYQLLDFGRSAQDRVMAREGAQAQTALRDAAINALAYQVARSYYAVLQADAFVAVQKESVRAIETGLRAARDRFEAGSAVKTDVLNLEVQLAQANEDLIRAENGFQLAMTALNAAIGRDLVTPENLPSPVTAVPAHPADDSPEVAQQRPEFRAAQAMTRIKTAALKKSRRAYAPTVNAFGSMDWDSDVSSDFEQSYMIGVMADLDIFDGFRRGNAVEEAREALAAARADEEKALRDLQLDLTQARLQAREARKRMDVAQRSVESAEEALRITQERYQQGAAQISELLTAQVGRTAMRTRSAAAQYEYLTALANLDRARGIPVQPQDTTKE